MNCWCLHTSRHHLQDMGNQFCEWVMITCRFYLRACHLKNPFLILPAVQLQVLRTGKIRLFPVRWVFFTRVVCVLRDRNWAAIHRRPHSMIVWESLGMLHWIFTATTITDGGFPKVHSCLSEARADL